MIDAARIREVLERHRNGLSQPSKELLSRINDLGAEIDALLRDLDAQGAAPAGWPPREPTQEMIAAGWIDKEDVSPREIWQAMWGVAPASPAHVLDAPTVEACAREVEAFGSWVMQGDTFDADEVNLMFKTYQANLAQSLRALTSGAKAGEREDWRCHRCGKDWRYCPCSDRGASAERPLSDKTDAWDEEHIKRRSIIQTSEGFKAIDREADDKLVEAMRTVSAFNEPAADAGEVRCTCPAYLPAGSQHQPDCPAYPGYDERGMPLADGGDVERLRLSDIEALRNAPLSNIPHGDGIRLVGFRLPEDVAGLSHGLFMMERLRAALRPTSSEEQVERAIAAAHKALTDAGFEREETHNNSGWEIAVRAILASAEARPGERP